MCQICIHSTDISLVAQKWEEISMRKVRFPVFLAAVLCTALSTPLAAAIIVPGADGSDGVLSPTSNLVIDLAQAPTGIWDQPGSGKGVYDSEKWEVVFKYSSVNIPEGVTVSFTNHPSGAPVVWLVQGDVGVAGTVNISGSNTLPGPGGFRAALGPGGSSNGGGSYGSLGEYAAGPVYGNKMVCPLIGGSGGSNPAGGGAILVAAAGSIRLLGTGIINANGGPGSNSWDSGGSGGAIRLISDTVEQTSPIGLTAVGGRKNGGAGRVRVETNQIIPDVVPGTPAATMALAGTTAKIWPEDTAPKIKSVSLGGVGVPSDPRSEMIVPIYADVYFAGAATQNLVIQAENVPLTWKVRARLAPKSGVPQYIDATHTGGDLASSTWEVQIPLATSFSAIQVRASVD